MSVVKINHIVDLQDARYCAAMGIQYLGFCLERGHMRKLADKTVEEISGWLSGPEAVLDFGQDHEGALQWLADHPEEQRHLQIDIADITDGLPNIPQQQLIVSLGVKDKDLEHLAQLIILAGQCAMLEVRPSKFNKKVAELVNSLIKETYNVIINVDAAGPKLLDSFEQRPYGIAFRDIASEDVFNLDYDKTESLMESFEMG